MRESDASHIARVARVVELFQRKWTIQILWAMRQRPVRLSYLTRANPSASKQGLIASLRSLQSARVVLRRDLNSTVFRVEYELADGMREHLVTLLDQLAECRKGVKGVRRLSAHRICYR